MAKTRPHEDTTIPAIRNGVPEANRVLLDVWVAEAQVLAGALYLTAYRAMKIGKSWQVPGAAGAATVIGYALLFVPALFARARPLSCGAHRLSPDQRLGSWGRPPSLAP